MASSSVNSRADDVQFALQRAKKKINSLQQQLSNKSERETRSESPVETSLSAWMPSKELRDSLVDMYTANPRVNEELRQRLPSPATHPLSASTHPLSSPDRSEITLKKDPTDWYQVPQHLQETPTSCSPSPLTHRRSVSPVSPLLHRRSVSPVSSLLHRRSVSPVSPLLHRRSVSPVSPLLHRRSVSPVSPLLHRRSVSPVSPLLHRRSVSPVSPLLRRRSVSPVALLSCWPLRGVGDMEVDLSSIRGCSPRAESCGDGPDGGRSSRGPGSPSLRRHLGSTDCSSHQELSFGPVTAASAPVPLFDRDKNISFLLKELDALRDVNKKLQDQLVHKEKELQKREVEEELKEEQREAQGWVRPAAVLEEVLAAQNDRDRALMSRLLLANEERDEALLRAHQLQQACGLEVTFEDSDMDIDELLRCVCDADSVQEVEQFGAALVQRLQMARQRRSYITAQEMKAVMGERDGSVAKCKQLEQELIQEREQRASKEEQLKGGALEHRQQLEAGLQVLQANHSCQDHLNVPPSLPHDVVSAADQALPLQALPSQAPPLLVQMQKLSKDKLSVEAELHRSQEAEREASERVRRLERLVEVLRKKVGTGSLRAVI